jgi:putative ABC transport system permease protein
VIGVLDRKGANLVGQDQDDIVLMPHTTVKKRLQGSPFDNVNAIMASARTPEQMADAERQARELLLERHDIHPGEPADFRVQNTTEIANIMRASSPAPSPCCSPPSPASPSWSAASAS